MTQGLAVIVIWPRSLLVEAKANYTLRANLFQSIGGANGLSTFVDQPTPQNLIPSTYQARCSAPPSQAPPAGLMRAMAWGGVRREAWVALHAAAVHAW